MGILTDISEIFPTLYGKTGSNPKGSAEICLLAAEKISQI